MNRIPMTPEIADALSRVIHKGQQRRNREPYHNHAHRVAHQVKEWGADESTIIAAYFHDMLEDTEYQIEDLFSFGYTVSTRTIALIEAMTRGEDISSKQHIENIIAYHDKQLMLLKLADLNDNSILYPQDILFKDGTESILEANLRYAGYKNSILISLQKYYK